MAYKPRDFNFSDIGTGLPSWIFKEDPTTLDDAIMTARKLQGAELSNEGQALQNAAGQDQQTEREAFKNLDPEGSMSNEDLFKEAEKLAFKSGDVKTGASLSDKEHDNSVADQRMELARQKSQLPRLVHGPKGSIYTVNDDGSPELLVPPQDSESKTKYLVEAPTGDQKYVSAEDANALFEKGWKKARTPNPLDELLKGALGGQPSGGAPSAGSPPPGLSFEQFQAWKKSRGK